MGTCFYLDPRHLVDVQVHRRQAEARHALFDHLAACARVGVKARADPCQLGLERVARDEPDTAGGDDRAGRLPGGVVGALCRRAEQ